ncbi:glycosyltransferase family 2 protein [Thermodesulfovibrio hydrogeniphilus]
MKKLCFTIPSWNRAKKLERCVKEMARQIIELGKQDEIGIFVSDNCSNDETPRVLARLKKEYPFLDYCRLEKHVDSADSAKNAYVKASGEYLWIFGDDDILLKDGLAMVWNVLNKHEPTLIHAGNGWLKPHSYKIYEDTVLEFANKMGFNQFIGWTTSMIIKKEILLKMFQLPQWDKYKEAAYGHVLGILHVATYEPAVVIDFPICQPMEQQTQEDVKRWQIEKMGWRYFLTVEGLQILFKIGILKEKLKPMFFKYLTYYLWDRFIVQMIASELGVLAEGKLPDKGWDLILSMADMIDDEGLAKQIKTTTNAARQLCKSRNILVNQIKEIDDVLNVILQETNKQIFNPGWAGGQK